MLSVCLLGIPMGVGAWLVAEWRSAAGTDLLTADTAEAWGNALSQQEQELLDAKRDAREQLSALALRVAELQARLVRIDALGERLTAIAKLDAGEFDFSQPPALGGPESAALGAAYQPPRVYRCD